MNLRFPSLALLAAALLVAAPAAADERAPGGDCTPSAKDVVDTAVAAGSFTTLVEAARAAGLVDALKARGPITVFAPNDEAFARLPAGTVEALLADKEKLTQVLTYHVVPGRVAAADVTKAKWAKTLQGQSLRVTADAQGVRIDGAKVLTADVPASNGIIHVIDTVLLPRQDVVDVAASNASFRTLVTAIKAAELVEALKGEGPFTVFAPVDDAFAKLPPGTVEALVNDKPKLRSILTFHVIRGRILAEDVAVGSTEVATLEGSKVRVTRSKDGSVTVNGAKVLETDVLAGNGVIHVIDSVILPPME
jgi:uncharacterized surface protein with fasciclin (FAS1) repeats